MSHPEDDGEDFELPDMSELPDMTAAVDQLKAAAPEFASLMWIYYTHLLQEGFTPSQALWASVAYCSQNPGTPPE